MAARKTFEVAKYAADLQRAILSPHLGNENRESLVWALDYLLTLTGNYKGFQFVDKFGNVVRDHVDIDDEGYHRRKFYGVENGLS